MARIAGVDLPREKRIEIGLTAVYGIGRTTATEILTKAGVISGVSAELGGNDLNKMIVSHLDKEHNLLISLSSAETLKTKLASLDEDDETKIVISGKDTLSGKQRVTQISANEIYKPVKEFIDKILKIVNVILSSLQSETLNKLSSSGIKLTGGGAGIYGICDYISSALDIKVERGNEWEIASIIGGGKLVENSELLEKLKLKV